jgi:hypothetical protein
MSAPTPEPTSEKHIAPIDVPANAPVKDDSKGRAGDAVSSSKIVQLLQSNVPYCVEAECGADRCVRLQDGRFHIIWTGLLGNLFYGSRYILASEPFADLLRSSCASCLDLRSTELVQATNRDTIGVYYEIMPHAEVTPENVKRVSVSGLHAWHFHQTHLFVSPGLARLIRKQGFDDLSFSPGFSRFAIMEA